MKQKVNDLTTYVTAHLRYMLAMYHTYSPAVQHSILIGSLFIALSSTAYVGHITGVNRSVADFTQSFFQTEEGARDVTPVDPEVIIVESGSVSNNADSDPGSGAAAGAPGSESSQTARSRAASRGSTGGSGRVETPATGGVGDLHTPPLTLFSSQCLKRSGQVVAVSGPRNARYNGSSTPNTIFNATTANWNGYNANGGMVHWAVVISGSGPACWYGGRYQGVWDDTSPDVTWQDPYHHSGAITTRVSNFLIEGYRADNQGDGVRMVDGAANFHIRGVYMSNIHDDCVENDFLHSGVTEDSLFDGCYSGFSADDGTGKFNGSNNTWTIRNNLLRMKPFPTVYRESDFTNYGCSLPNHANVFKGWWRGASPSPKVVFKNNILKFDIRPCRSTPLFPQNLNLVECSNNIIVYTGPGNFNKPVPPCVTVTKDASVWTNAVNRWKLTHPDVK